ncbi:MAG: TIM barrel protein [Sphingomonadales bacterium]|nr:TIM barrel protein [Sphingomonadales bacterium]
MAFELSVNIEYMFHEAGARLEDRIAAAAAAGFARVEMFTTGGRDIASLARALRDHRVELVSVVADPRTRLIERETHEGFRAMFRAAAEDALTLGCRRIVVGSGPGVPWMRRPQQLAIVAEAVSSIVPIAEDLDVIIMLEAVNTRVDHPGVLFSRTCDSLDVLNAVSSQRVRLLYDLYHSVTEGEEPAQIVPGLVPLIEHVQIADVPGRGEPGSGRIDWPAMLGLLETNGYRGLVGVECVPTGPSTPAALAHIAALCGGAVVA